MTTWRCTVCDQPFETVSRQGEIEVEIHDIFLSYGYPHALLCAKHKDWSQKEVLAVINQELTHSAEAEQESP